MGECGTIYGIVDVCVEQQREIILRLPIEGKKKGPKIIPPSPTSAPHQNLSPLFEICLMTLPELFPFNVFDFFSSNQFHQHFKKRFWTNFL